MAREGGKHVGGNLPPPHWQKKLQLQLQLQPWPCICICTGIDATHTVDYSSIYVILKKTQDPGKSFSYAPNMVVPSKELTDALKAVLRKLHQSPSHHISNPEGCEKRASVALVLRLRATYHAQLANAERTSDAITESNSASLDEFLSQPWEGDPEVLFIKRAGRPGDRWSGHTALPGGKRDPEDADDLAAAVRETREEVGLDLTGKGCFHAGSLPERVVTTAWGKKGLMVLCPYIFIVTATTIPPLVLQPTEVAAAHWVPLRALLSPSLRTFEYVDLSTRFARQGGPIARAILRILLGKMRFSAVLLVPSESLFSSFTDGFIPETAKKSSGLLSQITATEFGIPTSTSYANQPLLLWGLTLGVMADLLDMLPPYNASKLWIYPNFTTPDLRAIIYLLTLRLRRNNAGDLSSGTWRSQTAVDASTQAVAVSEAEPRSLAHNNVGIGGVGTGKSLSGYYERISLSIGLFLAMRAVLGSAALFWLLKLWRKRQQQG